MQIGGHVTDLHHDRHAISIITCTTHVNTRYALTLRRVASTLFAICAYKHAIFKLQFAVLQFGFRKGNGPSFSAVGPALSDGPLGGAMRKRSTRANCAAMKDPRRLH